MRSTLVKANESTSAVVEGSNLIFATPQLDLRQVSELSRLIDAYVLHETVYYFSDGFPFGDAVAQGFIPDDGIVRISFDSDYLLPFIDHQVIDLKSDFAKFSKAMRGYRSDQIKGAGELSPTTRRYVRKAADWIELVQLIHGKYTRAQLAFAEQLSGTFMPSPRGEAIALECITSFGQATARLLKQFSDARSEAIRAAHAIVAPFEIELSPPLLLAYAVSQAENRNGFLNTLRDMRRDVGFKRLGALLARAAAATITERIEMANAITKEYARILSGSAPEPLCSTANFISSAAGLTGNVVGTIAQALSAGASLPGLLADFRVRRHLTILRRLHRSVPSVRMFYRDLCRVFGNPSFSELDLRTWLHGKAVPLTSAEKRAYREFQRVTLAAAKAAHQKVLVGKGSRRVSHRRR